MYSVYFSPFPAMCVCVVVYVRVNVCVRVYVWVSWTQHLAAAVRMGILAQLILYGDSFKQMVGVLQFSMSFLFLGWSSSIIMVAMLFTSYWYLPLLYATWYYYDRHTQLKVRQIWWLPIRM